MGLFLFLSGNGNPTPPTLTSIHRDRRCLGGEQNEETETAQVLYINLRERRRELKYKRTKSNKQQQHSNKWHVCRLCNSSAPSGNRNNQQWGPLSAHQTCPSYDLKAKRTSPGLAILRSKSVSSETATARKGEKIKQRRATEKKISKKTSGRN